LWYKKLHELGGHLKHINFMMKNFILVLSVCATLAVHAQDTFSIVAVDPNTGEIGSAGASCLDNNGFPGSNGAIIISDIIPGRGAIHTQSFWNATNQTNARLKMNQGLSPAEIIAWLKPNDINGIIGSASRQYGIVDFDPQGAPRAAAHTGNSCFDWKGQRVGTNYAIQGNILLGPQILDSMEAHFLQSEGLPLALRLMYTLQGANVVGADSRCTSNGTSSLSAFVRLALPSDTLGSFYLDLNVPSLPAGMEPIDSLQRLFNAWAAVPTQHPLPLQLKVFPNPSSTGAFSVSWPNEGAFDMEVIGVNGTVVRRKPLKQGINNFELGLTSGLYWLKVKSNEDGTVKGMGKIIVQ
jgi:uncharacterized Ntn-hydrolase superfamily protein